MQPGKSQWWIRRFSSSGLLRRLYLIVGGLSVSCVELLDDVDEEDEQDDDDDDDDDGCLVRPSSVE